MVPQNSRVNPFNPGTKAHDDFELLSDLEWHCGKHELSGTQPAKTMQNIKYEGFEVEKRTQPCEVCGEKTVHRRLVSLERGAPAIIRAKMTEAFKERVRRLYNQRDEVLELTVADGKAGVGRRVPQIRWKGPEPEIDPNMSDEEIRERFMVLSRANNLLKDRICRQCVDTGVRPPFLGVSFYYEGREQYQEPLGCGGCGWYNPAKWRDALTRLVRGKQQD